MATEILYSGDGSDTTFDITFPYLTHADIKVSLKELKSDATEPYDANDYHYKDKSDPGDYSISDNTVIFTTAPANGTGLLENNIKITRATVITSPEHEYTAGSSITAAKLNENQKQALYAIEEAGEITATPGGISTGDKGPIFVSSDSSWSMQANSIANTHLQDNSVGINEIAPNSVNGNELVDNVVIPDNNSIKFGTGEDLHIYHDATNSKNKIHASGTGGLEIWGNGTDNIEIRADGTKNGIIVKSGAETELYHNGNEKFQTSSTGVTTTGTTHSTTGYTFGGTSSWWHEGDANKPTLRIGTDGPSLEVSEPTTNNINLKNLNGDLKLDNNVTISGNLTLTNGVLYPRSASGDRFGIIPWVDTAGVMEIGKYIDFHKTDGSTDENDRDLRIAPVDNPHNEAILGMNWPGTSSWYHFITTSANNIKHLNWVNDSTDYLQIYHIDETNTAQIAGINITSSDATLKENIVDSTYDALDCIKKLKLRDFDWKPEYKTGSVQCGLVAQEAETVNSSFVIDVKDGYKQLNCDRMVQVSLKAIQDLISKVETLEAKVAALEAQ